MINATILSVALERANPRVDAWEGQALASFLAADNSTLGDGFAPADVYAAITHLDYCPLAGGNVLNITVGRGLGGRMHGGPLAAVRCPLAAGA